MNVNDEKEGRKKWEKKFMVQKKSQIKTLRLYL